MYKSAILLAFLLLFGCCIAPDPLSQCTAACKSIPHSQGSIASGSCKCPCDSGYRGYNGSCISDAEYDALFPGSCNAACQARDPNSAGSIENEACSCSCVEGYREYGGACVTNEEYEKAALENCTSACQAEYPHTVGDMQSGTCKCPCEGGYVWFNNTCITQEEYEDIGRESCDSACQGQYPHSHGSIQNGSCRCPCDSGYAWYNESCITQAEYARLAPVSCPEGYPVMKNYSWAYGGKDYHMSLCYETESTDNKNENRALRKDYWNFVNDPYSNGSVTVLTNKLMNMSEEQGFSEYGRVQFAIAFVQGMPYTYDNVSTPYDEYPRYPSETIYDDGGDCEDTAILMAAVFRKMGYDVVLLHPPGHVAVGVYCTPSDFDYPVTYFRYGGRDYCYLETAGDESWKVGQSPDEYKNAKLEVVPIGQPKPDLYMGWDRDYYFRVRYSYNARDTYVNVTGIRVVNFGSETARNVKIWVGLETTTEGKVWGQYTVNVGDLRPRGAYEAYVTNLHAPSGQAFLPVVSAYCDNCETIEEKGNWVTWH